MLVKMKQQVSGTRDGANWPAKGETIDVPDTEAEALIANGIAELAGDDDEASAGDGSDAPDGDQAPAARGPRKR